MLKKLKEKNERGITLIALIITIIVMLILAMATISIVLGPNGVIKKASEANKAQEIAADRDQIENIALGYLDKDTGEIKLADFATENATINGYTVSYTAGEYATATKGETVIRIYKNGRVIKEESTPVEEQGGIGEQGSIVDEDLILGEYNENVKFDAGDGNQNFSLIFKADYVLGVEVSGDELAGSYTYDEQQKRGTYTLGDDVGTFIFDSINQVIFSDSAEQVFFLSGTTVPQPFTGTYTCAGAGTIVFEGQKMAIIPEGETYHSGDGSAYVYYNGQIYDKEGYNRWYTVIDNNTIEALGGARYTK